MDRRKFLQGAAALFAAPAIIKSEVLMPVRLPIWTPPTLAAGYFMFNGYPAKFEIFDQSRTADCLKRSMVLHVEGMDNGLPGVSQKTQNRRVFVKRVLVHGAGDRSMAAERVYREIRAAHELTRDFHCANGDKSPETMYVKSRLDAEGLMRGFYGGSVS